MSLTVKVCRVEMHCSSGWHPAWRRCQFSRTDNYLSASPTWQMIKTSSSAAKIKNYAVAGSAGLAGQRCYCMPQNSLMVHGIALYFYLKASNMRASSARMGSRRRNFYSTPRWSDPRAFLYWLFLREIRTIPSRPSRYYILMANHVRGKVNTRENRVHWIWSMM